MHRYVSKFVGAVLLSAAACAAQQAPPPPPVTAAPAEAPRSDSGSQSAQPYSPLYQPVVNGVSDNQPIPDTRPLSGILGLTLGSLGGTQNTLTPSFRLSQAFDSNSSIIGSGSDYTAETAVAGSLALHRRGARQSLDLTYNGGTVVYIDQSTHNLVQNLSLAQTVSSGRWTLTLTDALNYSPQGILGAGLGLNDYGSSSLPLTSISPSLTANQGIYTPLSRQLANTAGGQVQYGLSPRSSVTFGVTYGNVVYSDSDFGNTHQLNARTGYNRSWTAKDTVSIFYDYGVYRGGVGSVGSNTHSIQIGYARRVTGRLTWTVSAGPQVAQFVGSDESDITATVSTGLQYQKGRTGLSWSYSRGVSQAFVGGTTTDNLQLGVSRTLTHHWSAGANGQISRNTQLAGATELKSGFVGAQVQRSLGERASMHFSYGFQRQISGGTCGAFCTGLSRQVFGLGFDWTPHTWLLH